MNLACWIMLLGCSAPEETQRQPVESTPSTSTTTPATTTQPVSLSVVVNDNPLSVHHKRFDITADPPATVSVVCTLDTDPEEQHVVQADSASTHALNVFGLLEDSLYRCEILARETVGPPP